MKNSTTYFQHNSFFHKGTALLTFLAVLITFSNASAYSLDVHSKASGVPRWDSIKTWAQSGGSEWMLRDRSFNMLYDANMDLVSVTTESGTPPSPNINTRMNTNMYDANHNLISSSTKLFLNSTWLLYANYTATYDAHNNKTSDWQQVMNNAFTEMITQRHIIATFDANNNRLSSMDSSWDGSSYLVSVITNTYDANNNMTTDVEKSWDGTMWQTTLNRTNTFDTHHNKITEIDSNWSNGNLSSVLYDKYTNTYDANGNLLNMVDSATAGRALFAYDANNNRTMANYQGWNGTAFVTTYRNDYTFDTHNNLTSQTDSTFSGVFTSHILISLQKSTYTYDANNNQTSDLSFNWGGGEIFKKAAEKTYTFNADNNMYIQVNKYYNTQGTQIADADSTYFYGSGAPSTGIQKIQRTNAGITLYPNPASSVLNIAGIMAIEQVAIYDLAGKLVLTSEQTQMDISNLDPGAYIVKIASPNGVETRKFFKQ